MEVLAKLKRNSRPAYTITADQTVDDAISLMSSRKVSALIVTERDQPVGIFTESDLFRLYSAKKNAVPSEIKLESAMTNKLIVANWSEGINVTTALMIKAGIRHLPIVEAGKVVGMLTSNDLIEHQIASLTDEIYQLKEYIDDLHEAERER